MPIIIRVLIKSVRGVTNGIESKIYNTRSYLSLHEINEKLASENVASEKQYQAVL